MQSSGITISLNVFVFTVYLVFGMYLHLLSKVAVGVNHLTCIVNLLINMSETVVISYGNS